MLGNAALGQFALAQFPISSIGKSTIFAQPTLLANELFNLSQQLSGKVG